MIALAVLWFIIGMMFLAAARWAYTEIASWLKLKVCHLARVEADASYSYRRSMEDAYPLVGPSPAVLRIEISALEREVAEIKKAMRKPNAKAAK